MFLFSSKIKFPRSGISEGMTDYHSHLLPGVDDGAQSLREALHIMRQYQICGVTDLWITPHVMEDFPNETSDLKSRFEALQEAWDGHMRIHLGSENMLDSLFLSRLEKDDFLPILDKYLLVETSYFNPPIGFMNIIDSIIAKGYIPILAHPERYNYMDMEMYETLKKKKVVFQLNLPALGGLYGSAVRLKAEDLLKRGMYDIIGTDIHRMKYFEIMWKSRMSKDVVNRVNQLKFNKL